MSGKFWHLTSTICLVASLTGGGCNSASSKDSIKSGADVGEAENCIGSLETPPDPTGATGQLIFNIPDDVDPCSVSGYVVGHKDDLKVQRTISGDFFVNNVPPGEQDVVVVAGSLVIAGAGLTLESAPDRGIRMNDLRATTGLSNRLGEVNLPKLGAVSGKARLVAGGVTDHAGILVYIPGTTYAAYTDGEGAYSIGGVPAGQHSLYFEKDGFARGQIEGFFVDSEVTTTAPDLQLYLDTGITGNFSIVNSFSANGKTYIPGITAKLLIAPSADAVVMLVGDGGISPASWRPVTTNYSFAWDAAKLVNYESQTVGTTTSITSPYRVTLTAKFANPNGLESDTVIKQPYLDFFATGSTLYQPDFSLSLGTTPLQINATGIITPPGADQMSVTHKSQSETTAVSYGSLATAKTFPLKDRITDCGEHMVALQLKGFGGKVVFPGDAAPFAHGKTVTVNCASDVPALTSSATISQPAPPSSGSGGSFAAANYYETIWTGSKMAVLGWDESNNFTGAFYTPGSGWTPMTTTATNGTLVPGKRSEPALFVAGDKLVVVGGLDTNGNRLNDLYYYNLPSDEWIAKPAGAPADSFAPGTRRWVVVGAKLYSINTGGYIHRYDPNGAGSWTSNDALTANTVNPGSNFALASYDNKIAVIGGDTKDRAYLIDVASTGGALVSDCVLGSNAPCSSLPPLPEASSFSFNPYRPQAIMESGLTENGFFVVTISNVGTRKVFEYTSSSGGSWTNRVLADMPVTVPNLVRYGDDFFYLEQQIGQLCMIRPATATSQARCGDYNFKFQDTSAGITYSWRHLVTGYIPPDNSLGSTRPNGIFRWGGYGTWPGTPVNTTKSDGHIVDLSYSQPFE